MKFIIESSNFAELVKKGYSLDHIYLLVLIENNVDVDELCKGSVRLQALLQGIIRKGLVNEEKNKLTLIGKDILEFTGAQGEGFPEKKKSTGFDEWWKTYPATDQFEYNGRLFPGSRSLKRNRNECRLKFDKVLMEGDYTEDQMIEALKREVEMKKRSSLSSGENKLKYMQNSLTYLNQRTFESFIELPEEQSVVKGSIITDI